MKVTWLMGTKSFVNTCIIEIFNFRSYFGLYLIIIQL